jgi:predicted 3-demethylubiquinone-9 3-methyltransferase (glyoxalase superfamily)
MLAAMMILLANSAFAQMECTVAQIDGESLEQSVINLKAGENQSIEFNSGVQVKITMNDERNIEVLYKRTSGTFLNSKSVRPYSSKTVLGDSTTEINCN